MNASVNNGSATTYDNDEELWAFPSENTQLQECNCVSCGLFTISRLLSSAANDYSENQEMMQSLDDNMEELEELDDFDIEDECYYKNESQDQDQEENNRLLEEYVDYMFYKNEEYSDF
jgi:hypothetical protein